MVRTPPNATVFGRQAREAVLDKAPAKKPLGAVLVDDDEKKAGKGGGEEEEEGEGEGEEGEEGEEGSSSYRIVCISDGPSPRQ